MDSTLLIFLIGVVIGVLLKPMIIPYIKKKLEEKKIKL